MQKAYVKLIDKASASPDGPSGLDPEALWGRLRHNKNARGYTLALVRQIVAAQQQEYDTACRCQRRQYKQNSRHWRCPDCGASGFSINLRV